MGERGGCFATLSVHSVGVGSCFLLHGVMCTLDDNEVVRPSGSHSAEFLPSQMQNDDFIAVYPSSLEVFLTNLNLISSESYEHY